LKAAIGTDLHAMSHITGGGVPGNLPRMLPKGTKAQVRMPTMPEVFRLIAEGGPVDIAEMHRTFNLGVGLAVALAPGAVSAAKEALVGAGEKVFELGEVFTDAVDCEPFVEFV
jgi:phosphoribosylformylglycinamidine cyclo-ligase